MAGLVLHTEGRSDDQAQDDPGVCGADNIQGVQKRMNYKINFTVFGVCVIKASRNVILIIHITPGGIRTSPRCQMLLTSSRWDT